jgi:hypothetical protein
MQVKKNRSISQSSEIKQGAYLSNALPSPHDLYEALNPPVTEKLLNYFPGEGDFFFREGDSSLKTSHSHISFPNLLYRGNGRTFR